MTYFIKLIKPYSRNRASEIRSAPKVFLCDTGLLNHLARVAEGTIFENCIFNILRQQGDINYYQKKSGVEIDFIVDKQHAFEVKSMPYDSDFKRLSLLAAALHLKHFSIIARKFNTVKQMIYGFQAGK